MRLDNSYLRKYIRCLMGVVDVKCIEVEFLSIYYTHDGNREKISLEISSIYAFLWRYQRVVSEIRQIGVLCIIYRWCWRITSYRASLLVKKKMIIKKNVYRKSVSISLTLKWWGRIQGTKWWSRRRTGRRWWLQWNIWWFFAIFKWTLECWNEDGKKKILNWILIKH